MYGFPSAKGLRRIDWTVPSRAPQGDYAPRSKGILKSRPRGSVASIAVMLNQVQKEEASIPAATSHGQTVRRRRCVKGWRSLFHRQGPSSRHYRRMLLRLSRTQEKGRRTRRKPHWLDLPCLAFVRSKDGYMCDLWPNDQLVEAPEVAPDLLRTILEHEGHAD